MNAPSDTIDTFDQYKLGQIDEKARILAELKMFSEGLKVGGRGIASQAIETFIKKLEDE